MALMKSVNNFMHTVNNNRGNNQKEREEAEKRRKKEEEKERQQRASNRSLLTSPTEKLKKATDIFHQVGMQAKAEKEKKKDNIRKNTLSDKPTESIRTQFLQNKAENLRKNDISYGRYEFDKRAEEMKNERLSETKNAINPRIQRNTNINTNATKNDRQLMINRSKKTEDKRHDIIPGTATLLVENPTDIATARINYNRRTNSQADSSNGYAEAVSNYRNALENEKGTEDFKNFQKKYNTSNPLTAPKAENENTGEHTTQGSKNSEFLSLTDQLTDEEKAYYTYLGTKNVYDQKAYMDFLIPELQQRKAQKEPEGNGFKQGIESFASGLGTAMNGIATGTQALAGIGQPWKNQTPLYGNTKNAVTRERATGTQKVINDLSNSIGNMTPALITSAFAGPTAAAVATGLNTGGQKYKESVDNGLTDEQAKTAGILSGASETGTQYLLGGIKGLSKAGGLSAKLAKLPMAEKIGGAVTSASKNLVKNPTARAVLNSLGKDALKMGDEALEEYLQEAVISPLIDSAVTGENPNINLTSPQALEAAALGALTAGALNLPSNTANMANNIHNARYNANVAKVNSNNNINNDNVVAQQQPITKTVEQTHQVQKKAIETDAFKNLTIETQGVINELPDKIKNNLYGKDTHISRKDMFNAAYRYLHKNNPEMATSKNSRLLGLNVYDELYTPTAQKDIISQQQVPPQQAQQPTPQFTNNSNDVVGQNTNTHTTQNRADLDQNTINSYKNIFAEKAKAYNEKVLSESGYESGQQISNDEDITKREKKSDMTLGQKFSTNWTDRGKAISDIAIKSNDGILVKKYNVAKNAEAIQQHSLGKEQLDGKFNKVGKSVTEIYEPAAKWIGENSKGMKGVERESLNVEVFDDINRYVLNKHNNDRIKTNTGFLSDAERLSDVQMKMLEQKYPFIKQTQTEIVKYFDNNLQTLVDEGLVSKETAAKLRAKYPNYVATHRINEVESSLENIAQNINDEANGHKVSNNVNALKKDVSDTSTPIKSMTDTLATSATMTTKNVLRNQVLQSLADLHANGKDSGMIKKIVPVEDFSAQPNKNVYRFYIKGQMFDMYVNDYLNEALDDLYGGMHVKLNSGVEKFIGKLNKGFRAVTTDYNPAFTLANAIRDINDASMYTQNGAYYAKMGTAYKGSFLDSSKIKASENMSIDEIAKANKAQLAARMYERMGANAENNFFETANNGKRMKINKNGKFVSKENIGKKALEAMNTINENVERAPRLAEFIATIDKNAPTLWKKIAANEPLNDVEYETALTAMLNADSVTTNFKISGKSARWLNKTFIPYSNAAIQGIVQIPRSLREASIRGVAPSTDVVKSGVAKVFTNKMVQRALRFALASGTQLTAAKLIELMQKDNEDYQNISDRERENYLFMAIPLVEGQFARIPKSFSLKMADNVASFANNLTNGDFKGSTQDVADFFGGALPNPSGSNLLSAFRDSKQGKTWTGADIETYSERNNATRPPLAEIADENTSAPAKWISKVAENFGDDEYSPKRAQYALEQTTGILGKVVLPFMTASTYKGSADEVAKKATEPFIKPFKSRFLLDSVKTSKIQGEFYDFKQKLTEQGNSEYATESDKLVSAYVNNNEELKIAKEQYDKAKKSNDKEQIRISKKNLENATKQVFTDTEKYKAAADKILANNPNVDLSDEKQKKVIEMQIDKEFGGAEYALQQYNKEAYTKAQKGLKEHGIPIERSYELYEFKASLPSNLKNGERNERVEDWLIKKNDTWKKGEANAVGNFYINNATVMPKVNNYDFTDKNSVILSQQEPAWRQRYEMTKQVFGDITLDQYQKVLKAMNADNASADKQSQLNALYRLGFDEASANEFYKIQSNAKGYKTESITTNVKKVTGAQGQWVKNAMEGYKKISHADANKETMEKKKYIKRVVDSLPDEVKRQQGTNNLYWYIYDQFNNMDY